jgi:hypothetical protein
VRLHGRRSSGKAVAEGFFNTRQAINVHSGARKLQDPRPQSPRRPRMTAEGGQVRKYPAIVRSDLEDEQVTSVHENNRTAALAPLGWRARSPFRCERPRRSEGAQGELREPAEGVQPAIFLTRG